MKKPTKPSRPARVRRVSAPFAPSTNMPSSPCSFPVVGLGASAGGLEALEQFLQRIPPGSGQAFVIVQHLDPHYRGALVELLQKVTPLPVVEIQDQMRVAPGHIYVIPPNRDLSILHGVLHLLEPVEVRGLRLAIDFFFRALAIDQRENAMAVILSGMGTDGTLGARAIKEKAGTIFVQAPASAKFDGMPRSAIDAGLADVVAPAGELANKLLAYLRHLPAPVVSPFAVDSDKNKSGLDKILMLLRAQTGQDFTLYKKSTICRRIERRMGLHQLEKLDQYVRYVRENPREADLLFKELLIGVTTFFRDPPMWAQLKKDVLPELLADLPRDGRLRIWVPGCATGEEAYSMAMIFMEVVEEAHPGARCSLQIFATDLDKDAIDIARVGSYPPSIAADVSEERLNRFFVPEEGGYRVTKGLREMIVFAPQNLVMDPPFTKIDLVSCRNLLIYLETELQKRLIPLFHYSLNPGGFLVLGNSETVGQATDCFAQLPGRSRIYRRQDATPPVGPVDFPAAFYHLQTRVPESLPVLPPAASATANVQTLTDALLLQRFAPAGVLTTSKGDIVYISGKTGKYLEPAAGRANLNIFAMAREGLSSALSEAFHHAVRKKSSFTVKGVTVGTNGGSKLVDVTIQPLAEPLALQGLVLVVFTDVAAPRTLNRPGKAERATLQGNQLVAVGKELQHVREELQTTREEMQTSQEELKSSNEELQSTNEELQSTNEELTTSKEEMQSMNEELQTVNHELQAKLDELTRASDDMKNLLNSTDVATLFLDGDLRVRRFTTRTATLIKLIPGDAGRAITDIVSELDYPELAADAREVLRTLVYRERQVGASGGRWFSARIMPYRTQDNHIDGVVITFGDITRLKSLEAAQREALSILQEKGGEPSALAKVLQRTRQALESARPAAPRAPA